MGHFVSFAEETRPAQVARMVLNLVDTSVDAGAVAHQISRSLQPLTTSVAAQFDSDPLIDYRAQRPILNYKNGKLVGMKREGIVLSHAVDVEGQPFLLLHGTEPDFHWDALLADMMDVVERFGVTSLYSFSSVPAGTPHTRPADMVVRTPNSQAPVLEADFWFPASFADYMEYHVARLGVAHTNIAVRVPMYLSGNRYSAGALAVLGMASSLSGLHFPIGDLEQEADEEFENLAAMQEQNEELALMVATFEKEYDANESTGFVTAPSTEMSVPSVEEIGRAAEQFLAGAANAESKDVEAIDPQGLARKLERFQAGAENTGDSPEDPMPRRGKHSA